MKTRMLSSLLVLLVVASAGVTSAEIVVIGQIRVAGAVINEYEDGPIIDEEYAMSDGLGVYQVDVDAVAQGRVWATHDSDITLADDRLELGGTLAAGVLREAAGDSELYGGGTETYVSFRSSEPVVITISAELLASGGEGYGRILLQRMPDYEDLFELGLGSHEQSLTLEADTVYRLFLTASCRVESAEPLNVDASCVYAVAVATEAVATETTTLSMVKALFD